MTSRVAPSRRSAYLLGVRCALSVPGVVLFASFFGFGAFAQSSGFGLGHALFASATFALPGQVVLADAVVNGAGLAAAFLAVTLTAVRLMPLTVSLMPLLRGERTPLWKQILLSHFVAVTVWVETMRRIPKLEREERIPFYCGLALTLLPAILTATALGHVVAGTVPPSLSAGLLFLTPIYFLCSMLSAAQDRLDMLAIVIGIFMGPFLYRYVGGFDLLLTGLIGGSLAYGISRWR